MRGFPAMCVASVLWLAASGSVLARDYYLTLGGGYNPSGNQVSLEKNALFFKRILAERYPGGAPHDVYFSDGDSPNRDVQFVDPDTETPRANLLLAELAGEENDLGCRYRNHQVPGVRGGLTRANLDRWFSEVGAKLPAGDRLVLYVTGHGGKGDNKHSQNTKLLLWEREQITVRELAALLDKVPSEVSVVVVMVQCYSGGFANLIFEGGEPNKPLAKANRCGFFATVHDRVAAGCTADIEEEDYREYSSAFWAAIAGHSRTGEAVPAADFDHDGQISFAEAHAHTLLTSSTIDISVKTSDALLRRFSKSTGNEPPDLVSVDAPYEQLSALASPVDLAVIDGLSTELGLNQPERAAAAHKLATTIEKERKDLEERKKKLTAKSTANREQIRRAIRRRWPELTNRWDPKVSELLTLDSRELIKAVESEPGFSDYETARRESGEIEDQRFELERKWVKCQRLIRTLENVALAANLPKVADEATVGRYLQLVAAESGTLGSQE